MARFKFRLERVLSVRRHEEERERMAFAAATQKKIEAERILSEIREEIIAAADAAAKLIAVRATIEDLIRSHEYRLALFRKEESAAANLDNANAILEAARLKLIESRKKRRVLENLRERRRTEWRREEDNREQTELDEIGLTTFIRGQEARA